MDDIEGSVLAGLLRNSVWVYPLVAAGHLIGVALLVGGSVPLYLRFLGFFVSAPKEGVRRALERSVDGGFVLAVACGLLLFIARASAYAASGIFIAKMAVLGAAVALTATFRILAAPRTKGRKEGEAYPRGIRLVAASAAVAWLSVLVLGRLIGYF